MTGVDPFGWVGSTIDGQFSVDAIAGEGAFGVVYRGTHLGFDAPIAVKCLKIPPELAGDKRERFLARFRDEGRLLHRLSRLTTGVAQALHIGAATAPSGVWTPYIVMEWLEGETLAAELRRRGASGLAPRGVDAAIDLLSPAAEALAIAHRENVSHRDVKPENLFIVRGRSGSTMKVVDFGIAKIFEDTPSITAALEQTGKSFRAFTPRYGAPEQFSTRFGATGPWTDVFAMALVLIEVASGRRALTGNDLVELLAAASDQHRRPSLSRSGVAASPALEEVIDRALAANPALRFPDLGALWAAVREAQRAALSASLGGRSLGAAPSEPPAASSATSVLDEESAGENRVCTVLFVDLADVAGPSARLDPEEIKTILDRCFRVVWEHVERLGGVVDSPVGGRVMAVFGLPRATDSDAERAVTAALRIQEAIALAPVPRALRPARLSARISAMTGRVFVEAAADAARRELGVVGDAVQGAARLLRRAARGAVVIGSDTCRLVAGRFDVAPLAPAVPPESGGALPAYRVLAPIALRNGLPSADFHGIDTALVGRAAERQRLLDALDTVLSEQRAGLVTLVGPPGVGRSRLLADLSATLLDRRGAIFTIAVQCSPLHQDVSYGLAASLIRRGFQIHDEDTEEAALRKLRRGVRWFRAAHPGAGGAGPDLDRADLDDVLAQIPALLGVAPAEQTTALATEEPTGIAKRHIAAAALGLLGLLATRLPIALLCDDLQWADDASLDLLEAITARAEDLPIFVVCSARPELAERRPRWGAGQAAHQRIDVAPLPRRHVEEMIRDRLRRAGPLSPDLVRTLADRAEGNPLTLVETLHLLVDVGIVEVEREGPWRVHEDRLGALALPATIQGIVQARLDRLDPAARDVLERAAVIGRTFWEGALDRLRRDGGRTSAGPTEALLAELPERQLIRAREPSTLPGEREYVFAESATHEVAYEMLSAKLRRSLHLLVADWLKARAQGPAGAALLALHYDRGGDLARAAAEYARAGAHAASLGENAEALRLLERARQIHDESEASDPEGGAAAPLEDRRVAPWLDRVRLRIDLGSVLRRVGRLDDAARACDDARARVLRHERRDAPPPEPHDIARWDARIDFQLAHVHRLRGATAEARALVERAIARASEAGAERETPPMYGMLAFLHRRERRPDQSFQAALRGLRVCRAVPVAARDERWREDVAQLLFGIGTALYARGRMIGAERSYRQALRATSESKQPHLAAIALNGIAGARHARGELRGVRDLLARSLRLKERVGDLHQIAVACNNLAEVELRQGNVRAALDHARRSVRLGEQVRTGYDLADFHRNLAEASLAAGHPEEALDAALRALSIAETTGRVYLGDVAVALARVSARAFESSAAAPDLRARAIEAAEILRRSLDKHFEDPELRKKAEECRAILARLVVDAPTAPPPPREGA